MTTIATSLQSVAEMRRMYERVAMEYPRTILKDTVAVYIHMLIDDKYAAKRLRRRAYVCEGGEVVQMYDEGYSSVTDAFITRPRDCKYCVFEKPEGGAILVNMFELMQSGNPMELTVKPNTDIEFPSVDAAVMYALTIE